MRFARGLFIFPVIFFLSSVCVQAQNNAPARQSRILILLDGSSSMLDKWHVDKTRYKAAENIILSLIDSVHKVNKNVEFALRVFGHQHSVAERNCYDTEREVPFGKDNGTQMSLRLKDIKPFGITPIAYSIQKAVEEDMIDDKKYFYSLILITDGGESCGGDICEVVRLLLSRKIYFKPYIISLFDSAPLAATYACMGDYLQVLKPADIPVTVHTIVEAYKPIIRLSESDVQQLRPLSDAEVIPVQARVTTITETVVVPAQPLVEKPVQKKQTIEAIYLTKLSKLSLNGMKKKQFSVVPLPKIVWHSPKEKEVMLPIATIGKTRRLSLLFTVPTHKEVTLPKVNFKQPKEETVVVPTPQPPINTPKPITPKPPTTTPQKQGTDKTVEMVAKVEMEDAAATTVEVYFTNGKGKFYHTTPRVLFNDVKTGATIAQFNRRIDANNTPEAESVPPGKYNVIVAGSGRGIAKNVTISPNKKNKVVITVSNGSLEFQYKDNPNRPVSEYIARVAQRSGGTDINQPCDASLMYEPGSYHVQVNTVPVSHFYIELDMNATRVITIPEPGFVKFTNNDVRKTTAALYNPLGDKYVRFLGVDVGSEIPVDSQKVVLKPGPYEVRFPKDPKLPNSAEQVIPFTVKSNQSIEVELK